MGFGLRMNALISLSVFNKMNDYYFFHNVHCREACEQILDFLCLDKFDLLDIVLPQSSQVQDCFRLLL